MPSATIQCGNLSSDKTASLTLTLKIDNKETNIAVTENIPALDSIQIPLSDLSEELPSDAPETILISLSSKLNSNIIDCIAIYQLQQAEDSPLVDMTYRPKESSYEQYLAYQPRYFRPKGKGKSEGHIFLYNSGESLHAAIEFL